MLKVKYLIDGGVAVNDGYYAESFARFQEDCEAISITNPLTEGVFGTYYPPRHEDDPKCGWRSMNKHGHDGDPDCESNPVMDNVCASEAALLQHRVDAHKKAMEDEYNGLPLNRKLSDGYTRMWTYDNQIEALRDALNGDRTKLDKMNTDFANVKTEVTVKHNEIMK